jgi:D-sedoheptulose 7-phosphate isomerase
MLENRQIKETAELLQTISKDKYLEDSIQSAIECIFMAIADGHRVWFAGNGGSAAEAQHFSAELSGKFKINRRALPAEALHVNGSYLTAVGNDYGFKHVYERMMRDVAKEGDVLVVLTTSGTSENIILAAKAAHKNKVDVIAFTGSNFTELKKYTRVIIAIPSNNTPHIQEAHLVIGHIICGGVESKLFQDNDDP